MLAALERQSARDFEILICDDGSKEPTRRLIEEFSARSHFDVRHLWQEHQGFRKCRILNRALEESRGEISVFLDGDCVPHRHYMLDHIEQQAEGRYLAGRRVELGPWISASLTPEQIEAGFFDRPRMPLITAAWRDDLEFLNRSLRIPFAPVRRALKMERVTDMKGCNYSVPKKALEAINGFDEEYEGYGREDTDVELRLQNLGYQIKSMKGLAIQFHVWHPRREFVPANDDRLEEVKRTKRVRALRGLNVV